MSRLYQLNEDLLTVDMLTLACDSITLNTVDIQLTEELRRTEICCLRIADYEWAILASLCCATDSRKCIFLVPLPSWPYELLATDPNIYPRSRV